MQGLPIPDGATLVKGNAATYSAHYYVPDAKNISQLNGWYERHIVSGHPWRDWVACPSPMPSGTSSGEVWRWQKGRAEVRDLVLYTDARGRIWRGDECVGSHSSRRTTLSLAAPTDVYRLSKFASGPANSGITVDANSSTRAFPSPGHPHTR